MAAGAVPRRAEGRPGAKGKTQKTIGENGGVTMNISEIQGDETRQNLSLYGFKLPPLISGGYIKFCSLDDSWLHVW